MLATRGFELFVAVFSREEMDELADELPAVDRAGERSLLDDEPVRNFARDPRLHALLEPSSFVVRALLFDKTAQSNWGLRWHQDLSIAVRERAEAPGFSGWTVKAGVAHAQAPASVLERMVSLRIHLDDCGADAGPLRVIPGSHRLGRLDGDALDDHTRGEQVCLAKKGDVLAFKPLLLHASAASSTAAHRRVLQLECAQDELPSGLQWRWRITAPAGARA